MQAVAVIAGPDRDETDRLLQALATLPTPGPPDPRSAAVRENARLAVEHDPVRLEHERWLRSQERHEALVLMQAIRLARSLEDCEALLRGEKLPRSRLDPIWTKAYGWR